MKIGAIREAHKWWMRFLFAICCAFFLTHAFSAYAAPPRSIDGFTPCESAAQVQSCPADFPNSRFVIGDFDGDRQPDVATVEMVRFSPSHSRYAVSFQLSKGRLQTIGLTGPAGGLLLLARDVNGDSALDLVLVTAWQHSLVAVFLNDGFGNFAAADPRQLRIDVVSSRTHLVTPPICIEDHSVLGLQYSLPGDFEGEPLALPNLEADLGFSRHLDFPSGLSRPSFLGRAPPASSLPS